MDAQQRITEGRKRILRHMLGMEDEPRRVWGYRNHYAVGRCSYELARLRGMERDGLIREGRISNTRIHFHATEAGCLAVGMNSIQTRRALGDSERRTGNSGQGTVDRDEPYE